MRPSLAFLLALLLIPALAAAAYSLALRQLVQNIDPRRPALAGAAEKYLRQPLQLEDLRGEGWLRHPRLTARKVRIENGAFRFAADELRLDLDLWRSLLHLAPRLALLDARNCRLSLRLPYAAAARGAAGQALGEILAPLAAGVDALRLRDCSVLILAPGESPQQYDVARARIRRRKEGHAFALDARLGTQPLQLRGRLEHQRGALREAAVYAQVPLAEALQTLRDMGMVRTAAALQLREARGEFWWRYRRGAPQAVQARLAAAEVRRLDSADSANGMALRDVAAELRAEAHSGERWRAFFPRARFLLAGRSISLAGELARSREMLRLRIPDLSLEDALRILRESGLLAPMLLAPLDGLQPTGLLQSVRIEAPLAELQERWRLRTRIEQLRLLPWQGLPGISTLDGELRMQPHEGEFNFQGENFDFHLPELNPPRRYRGASGALVWKQQDRRWLMDTRGLEIVTSSGHSVEAQMELIVPEAADEAAEIDLLMYAPQLDFAAALAHVPEQTLLSLPEWLYRQDHGGIVTEAQLKVRGPLSEAAAEELRVDLETEFEGLSLQAPMSLQLLQAEGRARLAEGRFHADLRFAESALEGQPWLPGAARVTAEDDSFEILLSGAGAAGQISGDESEVVADLEYLHLPELQSGEPAAVETGTVSVQVRIKELSMAGEPLADDLDFTLINAEDRMGARSLNGQYRGIGGSGGIGVIDGALYRETAHNRTHFEGVLSFCDWEDLLAAHACPPERENRNNRLAVNLVWPGGPTEFAIGKSSGEVRANLNRGHFLNLGSMPGQRFLQLLNLDSLLRSLQPGISALSAEGLDYRSVRGGVRLDSGVLRIEEEGLTVESANAKFRLLGTLDLEQSRLNGELDITLPVSQNLPWYSLLLGGTPAGAAALWVANQLFEDQIEKAFTISYRVQGDADSVQFQIKE